MKDMSLISLELLDDHNVDALRRIRRGSISEAWVEDADTILEYTRYGLEHGCIGHTYLVRSGENGIGVILIGEAIPWSTDPDEMNGVPFYRLMNFLLDERYRGRGIGGYVLETAIEEICREYGVRPIALCVHKDNSDAARFYERHGFCRTDAMEGDDRYWLRYPAVEKRP